MNARSPSTATITEGTVHRDGESLRKTDKESTSASLLGEITTLAARLDELCADQNPEDLSKILRIAFTERGLYNLYLTFLVGDTERTKALLEVFDKVCRKYVLFREVILSIAERHRLLRLRNVM